MIANGTITNYADFLALFPERPRTRAGDGWLVICPAHDDHTPSLWITPAKNPDFIADFKCQAGCKSEAVLKAKQLTWADIHKNGYGERGNFINGKPCQPANGTLKQNQNNVGTTQTNIANDTSIANGLTLSTLAEAKKLPIAFLRSLGISDFKLNRLPVVRIPYSTEDDQEVAVRFRMALSGNMRFKWRKGDHALPYGLNRLDQIRKTGWVLIVEGESDCWTGWVYGLPVLGAPGKSIWPPSWMEYLKGLQVYVWQEPEAQDFVLRVLATAPELHYILAPDGIKDISEAHIQGLDVPKWLEDLKAKAESGKELKERESNTQMATAYKAARHVIEADDPLELAADTIRGLGYGGDLKPAKITYLAATSRLLDMRPGAMPVHLLLMGPPSAGKNYTVNRVLMLLPPEAVITIDAGSPRVLIYDDSSLRHKVLIFSEADSLPAGEDNPAASAIRNLLQDHHLHYVVTMREAETGDYVVREVDKPGPTSLITTSTKSLGSQLMTRLFTLEISDDKNQIGLRLETQATLETEGIMPPDSGLVAFQQYLQFKAPIRVIVPFARELAIAMAKMAAAPRIQRDFARLISLIKSVALLRQYHRKVDGQGQIIALPEDYDTVRELVNDMYVDSSTGATNEMRKLVETVTSLDANRAEGERITNSLLAQKTGTNAKQVLRRARKAILAGWLVNKEQRKSYPADYAPGEPMPETEGLPILQIHGMVGIGGSAYANEFSCEKDGVGTLAPLTDDNIPPYTPALPVQPASPAEILPPGGTGRFHDSNLNNDGSEVSGDRGVDWREISLGKPMQDVVKQWQSAGAPLIHLGPGENCEDLKALLADPDISTKYIEAIRLWLLTQPKVPAITTGEDLT
jgi:hypothetical protein